MSSCTVEASQTYRRKIHGRFGLHFDHLLSLVNSHTKPVILWNFVDIVFSIPYFSFIACSTVYSGITRINNLIRLKELHELEENFRAVDVVVEVPL
jgi:hypothetical protein